MPVVFASTNKVYGGLETLALEEAADRYAPKDSRFARYGVSEDWPIAFCTPYGCSKGTADQYVLDQARTFGGPAAVLRMSCVYGPRQFGTEDQGWVAHFLEQALAGETITIYGDGRQVRDILHVRDAVAAYRAVLARMDAVSGRAFNLGGGPAAWAELQQEFRHPVYVGFHVFALVVFLWAGWRYLIKLAPKANPPRIGSLRRPPLSVFPPLLGAAWIGATALFLVALWGIFP